jgi:hypothetical protein
MSLPAKAPRAAASNPAAPSRRPQTTRAQWDEVRVAFHGSLLGEISLSNLAQNIDGCVWISNEPSDCPVAYIDLSYEDVIAKFEARGLPPGRIDDLVAVLRGTLSFDESFGEMLEIAGQTEARSDVVARNLERLGIPATFPVSLCALAPGTLDFCNREQLHTLWDLLVFARGASRQVIIGGEFRELLNAITHIDEDTLATLIPFRRKTSGLYLIESLGLLVSPLDIESRIQIARSPETASGELRAEIARRIAYFPDQVERLREQSAQGTPLARLVVSLEDLGTEAAVAALLGLYLMPAAVKPLPPVTPRRPRGFFRWFR